MPKKQQPESLVMLPQEEKYSMSEKVPEVETIFAMRRDELKPDVRSYADNLHVQILGVCKEYGVENIEKFIELAKDSKKVPLEKLHELQKIVEKLNEILETGEGLIEFKELHSREAEAIEKFFGKPLEVAPLPPEVTPEKYAEWKEKGLELHYLPKIEMNKDADFPGWEMKPTASTDLFLSVKEGKLAPDALTLKGEWVLVDERPKPAIVARKAVYENDLLSPALEKLRTEGHLADYKIKSSRFNLSWNELQHPKVKQAISEALGIEPENLSLPRAIEANYLGNAFYPKWSGTNTREWYDDLYQGGQRLTAGSDWGLGGLPYVYRTDPDHHSDDLGFRPLGRFSKR